MEYSVRFIPGEPRFDTLEVIKLRCDDSVDINSRIFGQAQLGRGGQYLYARVWSFETRQLADSAVWVRFERGGHTAELRANADGRASLLLDGQKRDDILTAYLITGSDLQGEYWGAVMMLPAPLFFEHFGLKEEALPAVIKGNAGRENPALSTAAPPAEGMAFKIMPEAK